MVAIRYALVLSLLIVLVPTVPLELSGQVPYAAEQAEAGEAIYQRSCSVCHLPNLQGSFEAPQLAGPNFRLNWGGRSMDDLWEVLGTMPPQATTSLTEEEYSALAAYLLRENGTGPGTTTLELTSSDLLFPGLRAGVTATLAPGVEPVLPIPGRPGNVPSPDGVNRAPETVGEIDVTEVGRTETFRRADRFTPVSDAVLANPPPGDWLHWRQNQQAWGRSPLTQIDRDNVDRLQLAWVWGHGGRNEPARPVGPERHPLRAERRERDPGDRWSRWHPPLGVAPYVS